jgi:RND family efflux transporter MFP subunit
MFKNKWLISGILIVLVVVAVFIFFRMRGGGVEVKVAEVNKGNILSTISASGLVEAKSVALGSARMAGRVEWVGVDEGEGVKKGQVLVKLDGYDQAKKEYTRLWKLNREGFVSDLDLERAKSAVDNAQVVAPFSGVVTEKAVIPGEAVSPGVPVMTVVDIDHPWVEIQVDEVDIGIVKVGQKVRFTTDAFADREFYGKITWLSKNAELKKVGGRVRMDEEDLVFRGRVKFLDGKKMLRPGMSVYAEIITGEKKGVIIVPREAVTLRSGKRMVLVIKDGRAFEKVIELGLKDAEKVEILKGLSLGQKVAISNLDELKDKAKIKVVSK